MTKLTRRDCYSRCECGSPDHVIIWEYYVDSEFSDPWPDFSCTMLSSWKPNLFTRIKEALKYIFKPRYSLEFDTFYFDEDEALKLYSYIREYTEYNRSCKTNHG